VFTSLGTSLGEVYLESGKTLCAVYATQSGCINAVVLYTREIASARIVLLYISLRDCSVSGEVLPRHMSVSLFGHSSTMILSTGQKEYGLCKISD